MKTTEELRRELHEAEKREQQEREEKKKSVKRKWQFTLLPPTQKYSDLYDRIFDPSCVIYTLKGEIINQEECKQAGWSDSEIQSGSMNYLYNTLSHRIVMSVGGGRVFIADGAFRGDEKARKQGDQAITELGDFLHSHPQGGYVTEIILRQDDMNRVYG